MKSIRFLMLFTALVSFAQWVLPMYNTPFMLACKRGDWNTILTLLHTQVDVNQKDSDGHTALHIVVDCLNAATAQKANELDPEVDTIKSVICKLVAEGAKIDSVSNDGLTPLMVCILAQDHEAIQLLLYLGADKNLRPSGNYANNLSALEFARAKMKLDARLKSPTAACADIVNLLEGYSQKKNPILADMRAFTFPERELPFEEIFSNVQDRKSSPFAQQGASVTPDHKTASMVADSSNEFPLEQGALYGPYNGGKKVYTRSGLLEGLKNKTLIPDEMHDATDIAPIITAAESGDLEVVQELVDNGLTVFDQIDDGYETALHKAARLKDTEILNLLIDQEADLETQNDKGQTPIMVAIESNNYDAVNLLFNVDVAINKSNKKKETILMQAINVGNPKIVELLFKDSGLSLKPKNGITPMEFARNKLKRLTPAELISEKGKNLAYIVAGLDHFATEKSNTALAKLQSEEENKMAQETSLAQARSEQSNTAIAIQYLGSLNTFMYAKCKLAHKIIGLVNAYAFSESQLHQAKKAGLTRSLNNKAKDKKTLNAPTTLLLTDNQVKTRPLANQLKKQRKVLKANTK